MFCRSDEPYHICYRERISSKESSEEEEDMIMVSDSYCSHFVSYATLKIAAVMRSSVS